MNKEVTNKIVEAEIEKFSSLKPKWSISDLDFEKQIFRVNIKSEIDEEDFILEIFFEDYPEIPPLLDFIEPETGIKGTKKAYPRGNGDSFFHKGLPCICNPCSRKSYKTHNPNAPHGDWDMLGWKSNKKIGSLKKLYPIIEAIYRRINKRGYYAGRMA